jgi:hypothetical protein
MFGTIRRTNTDYFSEQHSPSGFCTGDTACFLWCTSPLPREVILSLSTAPGMHSSRSRIPESVPLCYARSDLPLEIKPTIIALNLYQAPRCDHHLYPVATLWESNTRQCCEYYFYVSENTTSTNLLSPQCTENIVGINLLKRYLPIL